jgi:glutamate formiminotransferase
VTTSPRCLECVVNVSEGRDETVLAALSASAGPALLDLHRDPHHHRTVLTLAGAPDDVASAARSLATATVGLLDLRTHDGVHPRLGVLDVVPFVPYEPGHAAPSDLTAAVAHRDDFARWLADELGVPSFLYGPLPGGRNRTLPDIRRDAFGPAAGLTPDFGPARPNPRTGATAVGARRVLVAYNVWVSSLEVARLVAPRVRISCNLLEPDSYGPAQLYDTVAVLAAEAGGAVEGAELVGLLPAVVLAAVPPARRPELGLSAEATVEFRLP